MGQTRGFFGRSRRMLRAKTVTFLRTESGLSALSSSWTYVAGQKGDVSRHRARSTLSYVSPSWACWAHSCFF